MTTWTDDRIERLKTLWNAGGHSCAEIAAVLGGGISRNSVIGKITRLGLQKRRDRSTLYVAKPKRPRAERTLRRNGAGFVLRDPIEQPDVTPDLNSLAAVESQPVPPTFLGIAFAKLKNNHCRYPRGEGINILFCGQPKLEGSSYCPQCHRRCHTRGSAVPASDAAKEARLRGILRAKAANARDAA